MDRIGSRHRIDHRELIEPVADALSIGVAATRADGERQRLEPVRPVREHEIVGTARCVRQHLPDRRVRVRTRFLELADAVVEREAPFLDAAQHEGRRDDLGQPAEVKRRVRMRRVGSVDVCLTEGELLDRTVDVHDGRRQARNTGLRAQRIEIIGEIAVKEILRVQRHANDQDDGDEERCEPAHSVRRTSL